MFRSVVMPSVLAVLISCTPVSTNLPPPDAPRAPQPVARTGSPQSAGDFGVVVRRVEPVAEQVCRELRPQLNCDFEIMVDRREGLPPNAFQTYDEQGRPVIGFTTALFGEMRNHDELAFALSHEAAHHIQGHIAQTQVSGATGAILGGILGSLAGLDPAGIDMVQDIGGTIGARQFSKTYELEADSLGARIALRSGYDPLRGVLYFQSAPDPGDRFLGTHPPNANRIDVVRRTVAAY